MKNTDYKHYTINTYAECVLFKVRYDNLSYKMNNSIDINDVHNIVADLKLVMNKVHDNTFDYDTSFSFNSNLQNLEAKVFYNDSYAIVRFPDDRNHFIYEVLFMRMKTGVVDADEIRLWIECAKETCRERKFLNLSIFHINRIEFISTHSDDYQLSTVDRTLKIDFTNLQMELVSNKYIDNRADKHDKNIILIPINDKFNVDAYKRFITSDIITLTDVSRRQLAIDNVNKYMKLNGFIDDE